jgi:hypothetical protein
MAAHGDISNCVVTPPCTEIATPQLQLFRFEFLLFLIAGQTWKVKFSFKFDGGRAIAQAVSRWLPTSADRVRARVWQVGFVVDKVASGQGFSEYFGFPSQNRSFHQLLHHHNHPLNIRENRGASHWGRASCRVI